MLPSVDDKVGTTERLLLSLVNEIAMDILPLDQIIRHHELTNEQFDVLSNTDRFKRLLDDAVRSWNAAENVDERIRLKTATMLEMSLPEMFERLHDKDGLTPAKTKLFELLQKGSGVGQSSEGAGGERVSIVINMGQGDILRAEARLPERVIEHTDDM